MSRTTLFRGIATVTAAVAATAVAVTVAAAAPPGAAHHRAVHAAAGQVVTAGRAAVPKPVTGAVDPVTALAGSGTFDDGAAWSVTLESYRGVPQSFADQWGQPVPAGDHVLCRRMVIGGRLVDAQGGPWADCSPEDAAGPAGETGLFGFTDKGVDGDRVLTGLPEAGVARVTVELNDHNARTTQVVTVPGTHDRGWAFGLSDGETIAAIDSYDAAGHLVDRDTSFQ